MMQCLNNRNFKLASVKFIANFIQETGLPSFRKTVFYSTFIQKPESVMTYKSFESFDQTQLDLLAEQCIVVNGKDEVVGASSKKDCHLWENITTNNLLHRAFSVILFNSKNELLIQQRSDAKITYPLHFTNTCCSHPLYVESEMDHEEAMGVKRAAQRRLHYELGIPTVQLSSLGKTLFSVHSHFAALVKEGQVPPEEMTLMARIHYAARNHPDERWGEHEIDYILVLRKDVDLDINVNEVKTVSYVTPEALKSMLQNCDAKASSLVLTPWFRLLCEKEDGLLFKWWNQLDKLESLRDTKIRKWL